MLSFKQHVRILLRSFEIFFILCLVPCLASLDVLIMVQRWLGISRGRSRVNALCVLGLIASFFVYRWATTLLDAESVSACLKNQTLPLSAETLYRCPVLSCISTGGAALLKAGQALAYVMHFFTSFLNLLIAFPTPLAFFCTTYSLMRMHYVLKQTWV